MTRMAALPCIYGKNLKNPLLRNPYVFHLKPVLDGRVKLYSNGLHHMTRMAAMPIYGKGYKVVMIARPYLCNI